MSASNQQQFRIEGMHCSSCAMSIDMEIEDVEGVSDASTSFAKATTVVTFDPQRASSDQIVAAIKRAGFEPQPL